MQTSVVLLQQVEISEAKSFQHQCAENVEKFDVTKFDFQVIFPEKKCGVTIW